MPSTVAPTPYVRPRPEPASRAQPSGAARFARLAARGPLQILLAAIALLWLVPTFALLITSLLPAGKISQLGWWKVIADPSTATLENYRAIFANHAITHALATTVIIAVGNTLLLVVVAALAGYAFAWLEFPGRDALFIVVIGLLVSRPGRPRSPRSGASRARAPVSRAR